MTDTNAWTQYLEVVSLDVSATCSTYERVHGLTFGEPQPELGNARTAASPDGGTVGVRAPMHDQEEPVMRSYFLVPDIEAAVAMVTAEGAEVMVPPMEIPGRGRCALYLMGGVQHALWER